ncbi:MAG: radical SAM family heme chaperone HemW [Bacteroidota bacterium]
MKGLYIHIPFCRQACRYCDFYFSVTLHKMDEFVARLVEEIETCGKRYPAQILDTLYLGGGTPSLLSPKQLDWILEAVHGNFSFRDNPEVTMECNPDDLDAAFPAMIKGRGFNRLSIGVQSFHEKELQLMRRSHNAEQAKESVKRAASAGFDNITLDLIYGIPGQSAAGWEENVNQALSLPISHLSAYHLTFEKGTLFDHWRRKGRLIPVHEDESVSFYRLLRERALSAGFDHYEISNFALPGKMSQHNLLYWSGLPYLGVGPSAHSFDGSQRSWNIASLKKYMEGISRGLSISESEELSPEEQYHDYLITTLRTRWGADPNQIDHRFGEEIKNHFDLRSRPFLEEGTMWKPRAKIAIHPNHWLITDHILKELFVD